MRYVLNDDGYIYDVAFGSQIECSLGTCTEYSGEVPSDYETIEEWLDGEIDKLNAWKIVDGNLVFDNDKYKELQNKYKLEEEDNAPATKKYVNDKISNNSQVVIDELSANVEGSSCIPINDSGNYEIAKMKLTSLGTETHKEGTNVTLEDSRGDDLVKLALDGRSTQETRSGKNMIKPITRTITSLGLTYTYNAEDNTVNIKGTTTSSSVSISLTDLRPTLKKGVSYTQSVVTIGGTQENVHIVPSVVNSSGTISYNYFSDNMTKTPTEDLTINTYNVYFTGTTIDWTFKVQLEEGSTATSIEKYGVSPSPDYPSEIESIEGKNICNVSTSQNNTIQYKQTGKNLFNSNLIKNVTRSGVTWVVQDDGGINISGSNTSTGNVSNNVGAWASTIPIIELDPTKTYTLSFSGNFDNSKVQFENRGLKDGVLTYITNLPSSGSVTITGFSAITDINFYARVGATDIDETIYFMITEDSDTNFEKYKETILNINLQGNKLCSLSNGVKDELIVENGRAKIIKNISEVTLNGSEANLYMLSSGLFRYDISNYSSQYIFSNYFTNKIDDRIVNNATANQYMSDNQISPRMGEEKDRLYIKCSQFTTLDDFKTWLSTHNTIIQYQLATSQIIDLGEVTQPKTFEGVNNISNLENTNMSVDYIKDITEEPINLIVSNENLLNISALTTSISGIDFTISKGTIKLNGTATENIELILDGSLTNTDMLFLIKKNTDYYLSGLATGINLNLYNFDGTNRTLINSLNSGLMNLSSMNKVTCTSLAIASGTTFNDVTIKPMLEINSAASTFVKHEENKLTINTSFTKNDDLVIEKSEIKLNDEVIQHCDMPITYKPCVFMLDKPIQASIDYFKEKTLDNRFASIEATIDGVVLNVSKTYMTKTDSATLVNSAKEEAIDSANASTDTKLEDYSTTVEMNSAISASAGEINLEVAKKVNNEDFTHAKIVAKINDDTSDVLISSDKLDVDAIATFTNSKLAEAGSTTINGANITTGTISAATIKLKNVTLTPSSSKIGGWTINSNHLVSSNSSGNSTINANGEIYFYPTSGGILGLNNGFRLKAPDGVAIYNDTATFGSNTIQKGITLLADSGNLVLAQKSESNSVSIRSYCSPSVRSNPAARCLLLAAAQDMFLYAHNTGTIWAQGNSLANSRVLTNAGASSSRNVKKNIVKFEQSKYDKALNLLNKMNLYDYDYKYNIYKNSHKYGFIIDELEELEEAKDFFEFEEYNATVKDDKIDFSGAMEGEKLKTKNYDSNVLDKYMLTCIKALLIKVDALEKRIEELEKV